MKYDEMTAQLISDGYYKGSIAHGPNALIDGTSVDREVANEAECPACGHQGMEYEQWTCDEQRNGEWSNFHSLAVCPQCKETLDF